MKKHLTLAYIIFSILTLLVLNVNMVSAEINMWSSVITDTNKSTVTYWTDYRLYDTSATGIGKHKVTPIVIQWQHDTLPYNISSYYVQYSNALVDWCNLTVYHYKNTYNDDGDIINTTTDSYNQYFESVPASDGIQQFYLVDLDTISSYMVCHYTNTDALYKDGVLFGSTSSYIPAFQCKGCDEHSFEELAKENEKTQEAIDQELSIYQLIYKIVTMNYKLWLILKWVIRITLVLASLFFIFAGVYYIYSYFKRMEKLTR